jgi:hypothetical protein
MIEEGSSWYASSVSIMLILISSYDFLPLDEEEFPLSSITAVLFMIILASANESLYSKGESIYKQELTSSSDWWKDGIWELPVPSANCIQFLQPWFTYSYEVTSSGAWIIGGGELFVIWRIAGEGDFIRKL